MGDTERKLNIVVGKEGGQAVVLTGKNFHILEDATTTTLKTKCIDSFVKYIKPFLEKGIRVFHMDNKAAAQYPTVGHDSQPVALLELEMHSALNRIINQNKRPMTQTAADDFFSSMRPYMENSTKIFTAVRNLDAKFITEIQRKVDNSGAYQFSVTKTTGEQEAKIPEKVKFNIPVFELVDDKITVEFDIVFTYSDPGNANERIQIQWSLQNFELDEIVTAAMRDVMLEHFKDIPKDQLIYGELEVRRQDTSWKIKESTGSL
jgi:hypothetical protein